LAELKKLSKTEQTELWSRYSTYSYHYIKALWYYISCENTHSKVKQAYITKLNRYAEKPEECLFKVYKAKYQIPSGTEIIKKYKGRTFKILIKNDRSFIYNDNSYTSLSAAAMAICGKKVSGNDFFGLNNKRGAQNAQN